MNLMKELALARTNPDSGQPRTSMVSLRLSREEEVALRAEADEQGESLSQFIREVLRRRAEGLRGGTADLRLYSTAYTAVEGGMAFEAKDGTLVPRTVQPYIAISWSG
jgi:hypothetical protein